MDGVGAVRALLDHKDPVLVGGERVRLDLHGKHRSGGEHGGDVLGRGVVGVVHHAERVRLGGEEVAAQVRVARGKPVLLGQRRNGRRGVVRRAGEANRGHRHHGWARARHRKRPARVVDRAPAGVPVEELRIAANRRLLVVCLRRLVRGQVARDERHRVRLVERQLDQALVCVLVRVARDLGYLVVLVEAGGECRGELVGDAARHAGLLGLGLLLLLGGVVRDAAGHGKDEKDHGENCQHKREDHACVKAAYAPAASVAKVDAPASQLVSRPPVSALRARAERPLLTGPGPAAPAATAMRATSVGAAPVACGTTASRCPRASLRPLGPAVGVLHCSSLHGARAHQRLMQSCEWRVTEPAFRDVASHAFYAL